MRAPKRSPLMNLRDSLESLIMNIIQMSIMSVKCRAKERDARREEDTLMFDRCLDSVVFDCVVFDCVVWLTYEEKIVFWLKLLIEFYRRKKESFDARILYSQIKVNAWLVITFWKQCSLVCLHWWTINERESMKEDKKFLIERKKQ